MGALARVVVAGVVDFLLPLMVLAVDTFISLVVTALTLGCVTVFFDVVDGTSLDVLQWKVVLEMTLDEVVEAMAAEVVFDLTGNLLVVDSANIVCVTEGVCIDSVEVIFCIVVVTPPVTGYSVDSFAGIVDDRSSGNDIGTAVVVANCGEADVGVCIVVVSGSVLEVGAK